jgi:hypothetical protein
VIELILLVLPYNTPPLINNEMGLELKIMSIFYSTIFYNWIKIPATSI